MLERQYKQGADRYQSLLLPPSIDEYVSARVGWADEGSPTRVVGLCWAGIR